ncbi:MAG TPA: hypothetical protein VJ553_05195 [Candidatus Paceibacterota bacterium]|nr:hypothetical protein [Candidatus Paceibacterota bacterium]
MNNTYNHREHYIRDISILIVSIGIAVVVKNTGALNWLLEHAERIPYLASFVVGMFFTSFLTVVPATVAIAELARGGTPILQLALIGGMGAMVADFILYIILREAVAEPLLVLVQAGSSDRLKRYIRKGKHRLMGTLLGAVIIASPLPDEVGLVLMGLAKARWYTTVLLTYCLNAVGIAIVATAVRAIL